MLLQKQKQKYSVNRKSKYRFSSFVYLVTVILTSTFKLPSLTTWIYYQSQKLIKIILNLRDNHSKY